MTDDRERTTDPDEPIKASASVGDCSWVLEITPEEWAKWRPLVIGTFVAGLVLGALLT